VWEARVLAQGKPVSSQRLDLARGRI